MPDKLRLGKLPKDGRTPTRFSDDEWDEIETHKQNGVSWQTIWEHLPKDRRHSNAEALKSAFYYWKGGGR